MSICLLLLLAAVARVDAAGPDRDQHWRDDLDILATQLPALHPNLFFQTPRPVFEKAVNDLRTSIPDLNDAEVMTGLAHLVALAGDGHTNLMLTQRDSTFRQLPLTLRWFEDGLFVTGAGNDYSQALGTRVVRIGQLPVDEAYQAVVPIVSHENDGTVREISPYYLVNADILQALKVAKDARTVPFGFEDLKGARFTLEIASSDPGKVVPATAAPDARAGFTPLWRQRTNENYWFTYLDSSRTLYFAYNACQEMPGRAFADFNAQMWATFDSKPVERMIIDLRNNSGGNSAVLNPFLFAGAERAARFQQVKAAVLLGRRTYSAAVTNAIALRQGPVTVYGEPSGGNSNGYGEVLSLVLPNSQLRVGYSTKYFAYPQVPPGPLMPDVQVTMSSADYFARHDPFLAAVLADAGPRRATTASGPAAVLNAAGFRSGEPVAPGSLASVFGDFIGAAPARAESLPLPVSMSNIEVRLAGAAAPLVAVSPSQINLQVPAGTVQGTATVRVLRNGAEIAAGTVDIAPAAPGLFVADPTRLDRPGAIVQDGAVIQIYGTGQGVNASLPTRVYVGNEQAEVLYSGPQPVFPGLWQINVRLPRGTSLFGRAPVFAAVGGSFSNAVTINLEN
jgi:uncharacterized protein (TIGR03437 family)